MSNDEFDQSCNEAYERLGYKPYPENSFKTIGRSWASRPDGFALDENTILVREMKRPREFKSRSSWLCTYEADPIKQERVKWIEAQQNNSITKKEAEARIVIAEHDDHYFKRGRTWDYPEHIETDGKNEILSMELPWAEIKFITALINALEVSGRHPRITEENVVCIVIYHLPRKKFSTTEERGEARNLKP